MSESLQILNDCPYTACKGKQLQAELAAADKQIGWLKSDKIRLNKSIKIRDTAFDALIDVNEKDNKTLRAELDKHRWIPTEDGPPKDVVWEQIIEAIEDCAEVPVFVTMAQIFMDEGSEFTYWRPIILPGGV